MPSFSVSKAHRLKRVVSKTPRLRRCVVWFGKAGYEQEREVGPEVRVGDQPSVASSHREFETNSAVTRFTVTLRRDASHG